MDDALRQRLIAAQRNELTEHHVYSRLAAREKDPHNRQVLHRIADDEKRHYEFWGEHTGAAPPPHRLKIAWYVWMARLMGITFAIKMMEKGEQGAQVNYGQVARTIPEAQAVADDENDHENELMAMIDEERLRYVGSVVLGLSDALVELTGALAGLTLAIRESRLIAAIGLITGVAAAMSMAASAYLSAKADDPGEHGRKSPLRSALYTGATYILTVLILVVPFILLPWPLLALGIALACALAIILAFSYYMAVARELPLGPRFLEMAGLSLGVAAISFGIGYLVRLVFHMDI